MALSSEAEDIINQSALAAAALGVPGAFVHLSSKHLAAAAT